jgi:hypothetical protein
VHVAPSVVWHASRVGRSVGGGEGDEGEGEKVAAATQESGRRLYEGGLLPY